ncbi:glycosyltransferase [Williamsia sterculiae]|uniref:UDP:flavonoid glycosyltransferase YjiC, YdhE family n=1 Tax=Williamsia sterculiae TaxID=1344003 RepID=A0A1N7DTH6_9NOCA|nr:glycosyltransferase [Williamsia sterculiae]SIR79193.1 UDP:flavonoid glycosyltransferase YjiC, YdhE family [Williamsia sterculiae]
MEFAIAASGSRGDVQPLVALGLALRSRGHAVTLMTPPDLVSFGRSAGLRTEPYGENTREILDSELSRERMKSRDPRTRLAAISEITVRGGRIMQEQLLDHSAGVDAIIATSVGQERAHNVAEVRGIPHIPVHYCPIRRNRSVPPPIPVPMSMPGPVIDLGWRLAQQLLWWGSRSAESTLRGELGLAALRRPYATEIAARGVPELQAYDPALFGSLAAEWGTSRPLVGFLNLPAEVRSAVGDHGVDGDLDAWLRAGDPPIYVGFGSMLPNNPAGLASALRIAADRLGRRLLVAGGWSGFMADVDDPTIRVIGHVDHDAVLPRCGAAVHHGGAGSLAAGLRAGLPTTVVWVGADQPMWGRAVVTARAGASLPMSRVDPQRLTAALQTTFADGSRRRAEVLHDRMISPEHAVHTAVQMVERVVRSREHPA